MSPTHTSHASAPGAKPSAHGLEGDESGVTALPRFTPDSSADEEWRPVVGYEETYLVSNRGRVFTIRLRRLLIPTITPKGYMRVHLGRDGVSRRVFVHRLVAEAFIGPRPDGQMVRHLNDTKDDNRPENLAYGTAFENAADAIANGLNPRSNATRCANGHEYSPENTRIDGNGWRRCRPCMRAADRRRVRDRSGAGDVTSCTSLAP